MLQPFNLFSWFLLISPVTIWNVNLYFELYTQAGILNDLIFVVLLINSLLEHIFFLLIDFDNEFIFFVTSTFEKFKLLVLISFISLNFKLVFSSRNLKNIAFLINSFKLIILLIALQKFRFYKKYK